MSSFPPKAWTVRFLKDMDTMEGSPMEEETVTLEALLAVKPAGGEEGTFKFVLSGTDHIKLDLEINSILNCESFEGKNGEIIIK
jgi:hypothetical protein